MAEKDIFPYSDAGPTSREELSRDLGFGRVLSQEESLRLLNRDGSFNVERRPHGFWQHVTSYHGMLSMPWSGFFALLIGGYLLLNVIFACLYLLCGAGELQGGVGMHGRFWEAFFFSVYTFATIGYGNVIPVGWAANAVVTVESITGLLSFALATGLVFSRFSRPVAAIVFSNNAVIAPYRDLTAFEFRVINGRENEIIDLEARIVMSRFEGRDGHPLRKYYNLELERDSVAFFPLSWTVVHPIDEDSPLYGWDRERAIAARTEFLVLLTGVDETFSQTVHARSSYAAEEIVWGARFVNLFSEGKGIHIDMERFHQIEPADLPRKGMTA
jgi:inward rectifier potassium channel